jgi:hypothetical protein
MQITSVTDISPESQIITGLGASPLHDLSDRESLMIHNVSEHF